MELHKVVTKNQTASAMIRKVVKNFFKEFRENGELYIMALPAVVLLFLFSYLPMGGIIIAFKDFQFDKGIFGSPWMKPLFSNFELILHNNPQAFIALRNTLLLNGLFIIVGTIVALALALLFNEINNKYFKRITQSITFLPTFISWVVVGVFVTGLLSYDSGAINNILTTFGLSKADFYSNPSLWPGILLLVVIWKSAGYNAVVYLATISGIDSTYYEAAQIDGATRWQQTWYISLPLLRPTVIILTLLAVGRIMNADFGLFYNVIGNITNLYSTGDVLDTLIYRSLRVTGDIGIASATGFFQSTVSFVIVIVCNKFAQIFERDAAIF
jgi:putative aldouronate transport system permease protein